jgi:hypothetical protein
MAKYFMNNFLSARGEGRNLIKILLDLEGFLEGGLVENCGKLKTLG